jgi:hypothetical protein
MATLSGACPLYVERDIIAFGRCQTVRNEGFVERREDSDNQEI